MFSSVLVTYCHNLLSRKVTGLEMKWDQEYLILIHLTEGEVLVLKAPVREGGDQPRLGDQV